MHDDKIYFAIGKLWYGKVYELPMQKKNFKCRKIQFRMIGFWNQ